MSNHTAFEPRLDVRLIFLPDVGTECSAAPNSIHDVLTTVTHIFDLLDAKELHNRLKLQQASPLQGIGVQSPACHGVHCSACAMSAYTVAGATVEVSHSLLETKYNSEQQTIVDCSYSTFF